MNIQIQTVDGVERVSVSDSELANAEHTGMGPVALVGARATWLRRRGENTMNSTNVTLTGHEAIAYAARFGGDLNKYADPVDGARVVDIDEAREIAREDASLIWVDAPAWDPTCMTATHAAVGNDGRRPCVWGLGTSAEMAFADALSQEECNDADAAFLRLVEVGPEVQARVQLGDVSWVD